MSLAQGGGQVPQRGALEGERGSGAKLPGWCTKMNMFFLCLYIANNLAVVIKPLAFNPHSLLIPSQINRSILFVTCRQQDAWVVVLHVVISPKAPENRKLH